MSEEDRLLLEQVPDYVKWPRLLVVGEDVTREQANEIIVRTTPLYYIGTNDKEWECLVQEAFGLRPELELTHEDYRDDVTIEQRLAKIKILDEHVKTRADALGTLSLHYLSSDQIASCYVDGPHGWCDWDGKISCSTYNIGKWPTPEEVHSDVTEIAEAFPFLNMTVQVLGDHWVHDESHEYGGYYELDETVPVTWHVVAGQVRVDVAPRVPMTAATELTLDEAWLERRFTDPFAERGVSIERLRQAVTQVEKFRAPKKEEDDGDQRGE